MNNILILIVICLIAISVNCIDDKDNSDNQPILSRKRRYLIFPSGATLQVGEWQQKIETNLY